MAGCDDYELKCSAFVTNFVRKTRNCVHRVNDEIVTVTAVLVVNIPVPAVLLCDVYPLPQKCHTIFQNFLHSN